MIMSHDSWHFVSFPGATKPVTDICVDSINNILGENQVSGADLEPICHTTPLFISVGVIQLKSGPTTKCFVIHSFIIRYRQWNTHI